MEKRLVAFLCTAAGALLLSGGGLHAQDLVSLDAWVKEQGLTPTIDGGTSGSHYEPHHLPQKAFNGVTYSAEDSERWLASIKNGTYLQYGLPENLTTQFTVKAYRLHALSNSWYPEERAPRSWAIYGHQNPTAAADDPGWVLIDEQTDVQWPFETGNYDASVPASKYVVEFTLASAVTCQAYKFVPLSSKLTNNSWETGLMELVWLGNESTDGYVVVQGAPGNLGEVSPTYGTVAGLPAGTNVTFTASAVAYTDSIRYRRAGYVLEKLDADGAWVLDGTNLNVNSYAYVGDGNGRRLTWLWEEDGYTLTTGVEFGGAESVTASPEPETDGYYAKGTEVTLTPIVPEGTESRFKNWYGDVPEGAENANPLTLTMDASKTVYAHFRRVWSILPGTTYQITDGNWTLRLSAPDDGTCDVGVNATYRAPLAGSGILDLTGVEDDTGLRLRRVRATSFQGYADLVEIILPDSVTSINESAFQGCTGLRAVKLPAALTTIAGHAFRDSPALQTVTPFLPSTLNELQYNAFAGCKSLNMDLKLNCPALTFVGTTAFSGSGVTSVDLSGSGVTLVRGWAFSTCLSLTNAVLGSQIQEISTNAFHHCSNLVHVALGPQLQHLRNGAFQNCPSLETVTPFLPETLTTLERDIFRFCSKLTGDLKLNCPSLTTVGGTVFDQCALTSVDMSGSGITKLSQWCFNGNTKMTGAVLPDSLQSIDKYAFGRCYELETVTPFLPKTVTSIGEGAFIRNKKLTGDLQITNPEFTSVETLAFQDVPLTCVTLPDSAFTIGDSAFENVPAATPVYFLGRAPASIGANTFSAGTSRRILYVCRRIDPDGWAAYTSALTDEDRADESFPGRATFGILVKDNIRHWLLHWNSPFSHNPTLLRAQ